MMMKSKFDHGNQEADGDGETDWNNGQLLLHDIEEISKALYLHNTPSKASFSSARNRSKSAGRSRLSKPQDNLTPRFQREDLLPKDKKLSSTWNWKKPLKALAHIGHRKFNCCFNLHVHSIEGLPSNFNDMSLCVHWKRKSSILQTPPSRVFQGAVEFGETLTHICSVYGSRAGSSHSVKYESKRFLIYASIVGAPDHDMGNHQVDLTLLLPLTFEELRGDKSSGKWSTSFRLAGKAVGATLNASFSYQVMKDELMEFGGNDPKVLNLVNLKPGGPHSTENVVDFSPSNSDVKLWQTGSFPRELHNGLVLPSYSNDVKLSHEALLNSGLGFSKSISFLYQKLDEGNFHNSSQVDSEHLGPLKSQILLKPVSAQESNQQESEETEFSIIEQGVETLEGGSLQLDQTGIQTVDVSTVEIINMNEIIKDDDIFVDKNTRCDSMDNICASCVNGAVEDDSKYICSSSGVNLPCVKVADTVSETSEFLGQEHYLSVKSNYKAHKMEKKSHSLDDITESVASDFLNMLAMESGSFGSTSDGDPQSPREQLLRQFEKEALASAAEEEHARANQSLIQRRKAKILEDLETDSLMQQWGLNERDFENSPVTWSGGFGSPIELCDQESSILPSIGQGLGSFVQTVGGGFLRSMNPSLFRNAKNCGNLIIQASNSVVLPAKMGNDILEVLLHVASAGVEELCDHIYKLMPLQDITGKSIKHVEWDATTNRGAPGSQGSLQYDLFEKFPYGYLTDESMGLNSISLQAIAPMTINKIEALLIEGLRMQSGMLNEEASSYIHPQYTKMPAFGGRRANLRGFPTLERVAKLQLEDSGEIDNDVDGLMGLSIRLDQWLRLDSGIIEGDQNLEQILKILKVHHSEITELDDEGLKNAMAEANTYGRKHGLMGNQLTVAFVIQLRDPLRNYEPVGVPMLVITQVERVHIHAMQQDQINFLERQKKEMENEALLNEKSMENTNIDNEAPQFGFKINQIHLSGVLTKPGNRLLWGTTAQQQSGFRWLLGSGMGNSTVKHSSSKSKAIVRSSPQFTKNLLNEDILWSISYVNDNMGANNGKELASENGYIRNPDIIFPN
ncbi:protein PLASTID MOVEMENT IMPAIRED 1-RELATED 1-like isoform X2 [Gastrolobium bilobum]|uniref:protein PLASTID MOVEMENT IMPAIRED 1-RELATED 1-like isoform X2 n=1 Tax=Gastrolobium bilobum TaxID=150636 RepID=UPI002AAFD2E0|nr:protein PLASTID MOVEMENT IMPAIRED 1-RELATED 1-like isoform X2 [Gastrolobium bilobum]